MKPVAATYLLLMLLNCPFLSYGQGENNVWCFGRNYGLDFNAGNPVLFFDSMDTREGAVAVSDAAGNLLFYASPEKVWDRANHLMPNGNGLLGSVSSTQGAAAIQSFTNPHQYFLFTLQADDDYSPPLAPGYLRYSIVDMTLNNGFGDIIAGQKNIILGSGYLEKMVVAGATDCDRWLIVHSADSNIFHAYKVDVNGISSTPVVSVSGFATGFRDYLIGFMTVSPDYQHIALTNNISYDIELHSFDPATGIVSNAMLLEDTMRLVYGICYSPDGSKLYLGQGSDTYLADTTRRGIWQYDLSPLPNLGAVKASKTRVDTENTSGIRMAPNNKLYTVHYQADSEYISVINNPNVGGIGCDVGQNVFGPFDTQCCTPFITFYGLGNPLAGYIYDTSYNAIDTSICFATGPQTLSVPNGYTYYEWNDSTVGQVDTVTGPGTKWVYMYNGCSITIDTFHVAAHLDTTKQVTDTSTCFVNNYPVLAAPGGYTSYLWSDGKNTQQDSFSMPGIKWVYAQNGCTLLIDTFQVATHFDTLKTITDTSHCVAHSPITIFAPGGYSSYLWSDGETTQVDTFFNSSIKWVRALNGCNVLIDTVHFMATTIPPDSVTMHGTDTSMCFEAGSTMVSAPAGYTYYLWSDGVSTQSDVFTGAGIKWVYAQRLCYLLIDTFAVEAQPTDTVTGRVDTMFCFSNMATVSAMPGYLTYLWTDGNTGATDTFSNDGIKIVYAHNPCAERIDSFHVQFINDLSVDLGPDIAICKGEAVVLNATNTIYNTANYLWQDGSTNATYTVTSGGDYGVSVSVGPCTVGDVIRVHEKVIDVKLGNGLIPCHGDSIILDVGVDDASYLWQDGSTGRTYKATKEGNYYVKVTRDNCSITATVTVRFEGCDCIVILPTGFSPNNDGRNDKFGATINCPVSSYKMMIYNRWGDRVFYSEDVNNRWDGSVKGVAADGDVFNYYMEFKDESGKTYYYKGTVTLVR